MTRPRFYPRTGTEREARAFHLGLETCRYDETARMKSLIQRALNGDVDARLELKESIIAPGAPEILWNVVMEES